MAAPGPCARFNRRGGLSTDDGDWTSAVLAAIERPGHRRFSLASISSVHWSDGGLMTSKKWAPRPAARRCLCYSTRRHSAGVLTMDMKRLDRIS